MIDKEQAKSLVERRINTPDPTCPYKMKLVILDNETIETEWGWVFFYNTEDYLKTGDFYDSLVGNAPYIVNRNTGELVETGTAYDIEDYINEYESKLQNSL
jgi:hypothetical protein